MPPRNASVRSRPAASARWSYDRAVRYLLSHINYEAISGARVPPRTLADIERFQAVLARLGHPERFAPAIHVAGTNGKGSTAAIAAALLGRLGYTTGLYTSPHLVDMRERIQVGGAAVSRSEFARAAQIASEFVGGEGASGFRTTFELLTAMAFLVFCAREVDASVVEVGLGGRLDSTNVIQPRVSVITPISLDHMEVLGPDLPTIAADKAHILKRGVRALTARQAPSALAALKSRAKRVGVVLESLDQMEIHKGGPGPRGEVFSIRTPLAAYENLVLSLRGAHQVENAALAIRAVELFTGAAIPEEALRETLRKVRWPGRFDVLASKPPLVVDGAHNAGGAATLAATLERYYPGRRVAFVIGASKGKDLETILKPLAAKAAALVAVEADHPRAMEADLVARAARAHTRAPVETSRDLKTALIRARHLADGGVVCAAGSLYLVGDVLRIWRTLRTSWSGATPTVRRRRRAAGAR